MYIELVKYLLCPRRYNPALLSYEEARHLTIQQPGKARFLPPEKYLPPKSALQHCASLITSQMLYFMTLGQPTATLPDFITTGGLSKDGAGNVSFQHGDQCCVKGYDMILNIPPDDISKAAKDATCKVCKKRSSNKTPQHSKQPRKKKTLEKTPTVDEISLRMFHCMENTCTPTFAKVKAKPITKRKATTIGTGNPKRLRM